MGVIDLITPIKFTCEAFFSTGARKLHTDSGHSLPTCPPPVLFGGEKHCGRMSAFAEATADTFAQRAKVVSFRHSSNSF